MVIPSQVFKYELEKSVGVPSQRHPDAFGKGVSVTLADVNGGVRGSESIDQTFIRRWLRNLFNEPSPAPAPAPMNPTITKIAAAKSEPDWVANFDALEAIVKSLHTSCSSTVSATISKDFDNLKDQLFTKATIVTEEAAEVLILKTQAEILKTLAIGESTIDSEKTEKAQKLAQKQFGKP